MGDRAAGAGAPPRDALVDPSREKMQQISDLEYDLDQALQEVRRGEAGAVAEEARVLGLIDAFIDANPNVRLDKIRDPRLAADEVDEDTHALIVSLAASHHPASVAPYLKIVKRQPDILTKKFMHDLTPVQYIQSEIAYGRPDGAARKVLQDKLNPGQGQLRKVERVFGGPSSPLLPEHAALVGTMLSGLPGSLPQQKAQTKRAGRRKTRHHRKTRRSGRKTKSRR
jgi:hypothetical protein